MVSAILNTKKLAYEIEKKGLVVPQQIKKRDGSITYYDPKRIATAVDKCFNELNVNTLTGNDVATTVTRTISAQKLTLPTVETIQDLVISTLYGAGEFTAADAYQTYRNTHESERNNRPVPEEVKKAFEDDKKYFPTPSQQFMFYDKYSRYNHELGRRETWSETVERAVKHLHWLVDTHRPSALAYFEDEKIFEKIYDGMLNMQAMPSMRLLAMAGEAARRNGLAIYNCSALPVKDTQAFVEALLISFAGCGVGFSVERQFVEQIPRVKRQKKALEYIVHDVEDSTEGWGEALRIGLDTWMNGRDITFNTDFIRPAGSVLRIKGGRASGSAPLINMLHIIRKTIFKRQGKFLTPADCHLIMCAVGEAAVQGATRRTAMISLFDREDQEMRTIKHNIDWNNPEESILGNANNSAVWHDDITDLDIIEQMTEMMRGGGGEPGIFSRANANRTKPERRDEAEFLVNPCQPAWATVLTPKGISTIGNLQIGDTIWSGQQWTTVANKWSTGTKEVYKYRTTAGSFYGTKNHKVVSKGTKIKAQYADSIDRTVAEVPAILEINNQDVMDGLVIGDGSIHKASNNLVYLIVGEKDGEWLTELSNYFTRYRPGLKEKSWEIKTSITFDELPKTFDRKIPYRFRFGNADKIRGFLRGLYSANGTVIRDRVTLKAASFTVIEQVQEMLSSIGIRSYYTTNKSRSNIFNNGEYIMRESYDLNITTDRDLFQQMIGFIHSEKTDKLDTICSMSRISTRSAKVAYKIIDVEYISTEEVFDITVDANEHTYWTSGLLVSNCGEVSLRPYGLCNLSISVVRPSDTFTDLMNKVELATIIGTIQSLSTNFPGLRPEWKQNCEEERLLGVDLAGQMDHPVLQCDDELSAQWREQLKQHVITTNKKWAEILGINQAAATTVCKPGGNSSELLDIPSSDARHSKFYRRNMRVGASSPLFKVLKSYGIPMDPENGQTKENATTWVAHFLKKAPEGSITKENRSAIDQCNFWLLNKTYWTEHNPSYTVVYRENEIVDLIKWVVDHKTLIGGLSFLPALNTVYSQMPYETLTEEEYYQELEKFPANIDYSKVYRYELDDMTEASKNLSCFAGQCEL